MRSLRFGTGDVVLAPDYHHGNEILAMKAAGVKIRYYPIQKDLDVNLAELARLCDLEPKPRALYLTHFIGWPQPLDAIQRLCRDKRLMLIEDCALSFMSEYRQKSLGTFGSYSIFCLYKSLPLPNGGVLVNNDGSSAKPHDLQPCSALSVSARSADLIFHWVRTRSDTCGRTLLGLKRAAGLALDSRKVQRMPVGGTGFDVARANLAMSPLCHALLRRFDYHPIKQARRRNFEILGERLRGRTTFLDKTLSDGVCPLFFPLLVKDKNAAAEALLERGIETIQFWNRGDDAAYQEGSPSAFLREHVLEIPIHQDVTEDAAWYMADEILKLRQSL